MRKLLIIMVVMLSWSFGVASEAQARGVDQRQEKQLLKSSQKRERHAVKLQHQNMKNSWKNQRVSNSTRLQAKHQMERDDRALRERQKNERQDLKDRQRALKENQRAYGS